MRARIGIPCGDAHHANIIALREPRRLSLEITRRRTRDAVLAVCRCLGVGFGMALSRARR
jgi:hypothetical protein